MFYVFHPPPYATLIFNQFNDKYYMMVYALLILFHIHRNIKRNEAEWELKINCTIIPFNVFFFNVLILFMRILIVY